MCGSTPREFCRKAIRIQFLCIFYGCAREKKHWPKAFTEYDAASCEIEGSNPATTTIINGRLAQSVQSVCLTSRRSLVRIQHRPLEILEEGTDVIT